MNHEQVQLAIIIWMMLIAQSTPKVLLKLLNAVIWWRFFVAANTVIQAHTIWNIKVIELSKMCHLSSTQGRLEHP